MLYPAFIHAFDPSLGGVTFSRFAEGDRVADEEIYCLSFFELCKGIVYGLMFVLLSRMN